MAFDILLFTCSRRGDAIRLGRQQIRDGVISFGTEKIGEVVTIPLLQPLKDQHYAAKTVASRLNEPPQ